MRFVSIVALLAFAAPLPAIAATISLSLSGDPTSGTANTFMSGGKTFQAYRFQLGGFTPFDLNQDDTIEYDIDFTSPFTVPGPAGSQFIGVDFQEFVTDPDGNQFFSTPDGQSTGTITSFDNPIGITAPKDAGCGNCLSAIFGNGSQAFTISGLTGTLFIDQLVGTRRIEQISVSYQLDDGGAVPEPATWAMMAGGFGLIGGALRQRRRATLRIA